MIDKTSAGGDTKRRIDEPLDQLAPCFDMTMAQFWPGAYVGAAVPNDRAMARWPDFPRAALPASGRIATGCGIDEAACRLSGLGEAVELAASCAWGDEALVEASAAELGNAAISLDALNGFSPDQTAERFAWNDRWSGFDWRPRLISPQESRQWIEAREAATGAAKLVPAEFVLIGVREAGDEAAGAIADSNGCACGRTPVAARLAAVLELIERDAAGRWWFGRRRRPTLAPDVLRHWPDLCRNLAVRRRQTRLFDITTDLSVPVVAAASFEPEGSCVALGFAARLSLTAAAVAAASEMLAVETSLPPWRDVAGDPVAEVWLREASAALPPLGATEGRTGDLKADAMSAESELELCIEAAERCRCRILFVDLTRPCLRVPVFRAVSAELCHIKPRFGKPRLTAADGRDLSGWDRPGARANPLFIPL